MRQTSQAYRVDHPTCREVDISTQDLLGNREGGARAKEERISVRYHQQQAGRKWEARVEWATPMARSSRRKRSPPVATVSLKGERKKMPPGRTVRRGVGVQTTLGPLRLVGPVAARTSPAKTQPGTLPETGAAAAAALGMRLYWTPRTSSGVFLPPLETSSWTPLRQTPAPIVSLSLRRVSGRIGQSWVWVRRKPFQLHSSLIQTLRLYTTPANCLLRWRSRGMKFAKKQIPLRTHLLWSPLGPGCGNLISGTTLSLSPPLKASVWPSALTSGWQIFINTDPEYLTHCSLLFYYVFYSST